MRERETVWLRVKVVAQIFFKTNLASTLQQVWLGPKIEHGTKKCKTVWHGPENGQSGAIRSLGGVLQGPGYVGRLLLRLRHAFLRSLENVTEH